MIRLRRSLLLGPKTSLFASQCRPNMGGSQVSSKRDLPSQNCIADAGMLVPGVFLETVHRKVLYHCPINMIPLRLHHIDYHTIFRCTVEFVMKSLVKFNEPVYRSSPNGFAAASKDPS